MAVSVVTTIHRLWTCLAGLLITASLSGCTGTQSLVQRFAASAPAAIATPQSTAPLADGAVTADPTATPTFDPSGMPTALAPASEIDPDSPFVLTAERSIAGYAVRLWQFPDSDDVFRSLDRTVTLAAIGQPAIGIPWANRIDPQTDTLPASGLDPLTGTDITGEGHPDLVVQTFTGGAHCCFGAYVYDLGPEPTPVLRITDSQCPGHFEDLDSDGRPEFITCDGWIAYRYCSYAETPMPKVILAYEPSRGFVPAGPRFADRYAADITKHEGALTRKAAEPRSAALDKPQPDRCGVLALVLDHLYAGETDAAWEAFARHYPHPDAPVLRAEVEAQLRASPLYVAPGAEAVPVLTGDPPAALTGAEGMPGANGSPSP